MASAGAVRWQDLTPVLAVGKFISFVWFVLSILCGKPTGQTKKPDEPNKPDEPDRHPPEMVPDTFFLV